MEKVNALNTRSSVIESLLAGGAPATQVALAGRASRPNGPDEDELLLVDDDDELVDELDDVDELELDELDELDELILDDDDEPTDD
jgi:hypothetical protein